MCNNKQTITDPAPPEAMVKLAREIAFHAPPTDDYGPATSAALAALQRIEKAVRDAECARWDDDSDMISRRALLTKLGAKP